MSVHSIKASQKFPVSIEEMWDFISSPHNLKVITPDHFGFEITNGITEKDKMYPGQIIVYKLQPFAGIKIQWMTEITQVEYLRYFIDEQRQGPYRIWHHQHFLNPIEGGVQMDDIVHYSIPYGFIGDIVNSLVVRKKLDAVFEFRRRKLESLFGIYK